MDVSNQRLDHVTTYELSPKISSNRWFDHIRDLCYPVVLQTNRNDLSTGNYFDIISAAPEKVIQVVDNKTFILDTHLKTTTVAKTHNPFSQITALLPQKPNLSAKEELPFLGGWIGFFGYELNELLEPKKIKPRFDADPKMVVGLYLWGIVVCHKYKKTYLVVHPDINKMLHKTITERILTSEVTLTKKATVGFSLKAPFSKDQSFHSYKSSFDKIKNYINAGDCYQVNLTQRFSTCFSGDLWLAHQYLSVITHTEYTAFLDFPDLKISCHSPEQFILANQLFVSTAPIKGTIKRGDRIEDDLRNIERLKNSAKDYSENVMIVDLLRNDFGRVCRPGSIRVPNLVELHSFTNVHHLISKITGQLFSEKDQILLLEKAFPGGSITGAPKIRSMEIIRELEPFARLAYCGSIGYISCHGRMETNIAIRSLVAKDNMLYCWGGGGIVADSKLNQEYEESIAKVANLMKALERYHV